MEITENLKKEIQRLYDNTAEDIHEVSFGYKYKNGIKTDQIGVVFGVDKKININDLSSDKVLPLTITVDGNTLITDVIEKPRFSLVTCYANESATPITSYQSTNINVTRLQAFSSNLLLPLQGGQQIIQYPTSWVDLGGGSYNFSVGTVGFFCIDNLDNKIVGVTNSHVLVSNRYITTERDIVAENINPYNIYENRLWVDGNIYRPGALVYNGGDASTTLAGQLKRYQPVYESQLNYSDVAIFYPNPAIISTASHQIWVPVGAPDYLINYYPFASKSEIDSLLISNPKIYSTGRTTGAKGYGLTSSCILRISGLGVTASVSENDLTTRPWGDCITYQYEDGSLWPAAPGDSGSALVADFNGVRKIIGLLFAGSNSYAIASRIDRVASEMNIRAWDGTYNTSTPSFNGILVDYNSDDANYPFIYRGGIKYYQAGFTTTAI